MTTTDELEHLLLSMWSTLSPACLPSSSWCAAQTNAAEVRSCEPRGSRGATVTFLVRRSPVQLWARRAYSAGPPGAASASPPRADSIGLLSLRRQRDESPNLDGRTGVGRRDEPCRISVGKRVDHEVALLHAVDDLSRVELAQVP
jgi:hypothetical protein